MFHDDDAADAAVKRLLAHTAGVIALGSEKVRQVHTGAFKSVEQYGATMTEVGTAAETLIRLIARVVLEEYAKNGNGKPAAPAATTGRK